MVSCRYQLQQVGKVLVLAVLPVVVAAVVLLMPSSTDTVYGMKRKKNINPIV